MNVLILGFKLITTRGCAEYLEWLGKKENPQGYGWATANGHGLEF